MISATTPIAKPLVGLALLAAATGAGAVLWSWLEPLDVPSGADAGPSALSATDPAHEKRWNELNDRLAVLTKELAQVKQAQNRKPAQLQAQADAPVAEAEPLSAEEAERRETEADAETEAQENRLEQALEAEQADPAWSQEAAASWTEVFQREGIKDELKGIQLGNIDCRTSLCRVEVTPSDAGQGTEAFAQKLQKLPLFAPWQAPGFGKIENPDEGAPVGVFYLAREGHALP